MPGRIAGSVTDTIPERERSPRLPDEPLFPLEHRDVGAVAAGERRRVWLDSAAAVSAPHNEANASGSCAA